MKWARMGDAGMVVECACSCAMKREKQNRRSLEACEYKGSESTYGSLREKAATTRNLDFLFMLS